MVRQLRCCLAYTFCLMACFPGAFAYKAVPKFKASNYDSIKGITAYLVWIADLKVQGIYYPSDFPGMPSGAVTNVYLRNTTAILYPNTEIYNFRIGLAGTELKNYPTLTSTHKTDTFITFNPYVVNEPVFSTGPDTVKKGDWIKIPLTEGKFNYSSA